MHQDHHEGGREHCQNGGGHDNIPFGVCLTTNEDMYPIVMGIKRMLAGEAYTEWNIVMATAILAMLPPALVVILMQKWFVKGLVDTEK